jgi:hypothetical protein
MFIQTIVFVTDNWKDISLLRNLSIYRKLQICNVLNFSSFYNENILYLFNKTTDLIEEQEFNCTESYPLSQYSVVFLFWTDIDFIRRLFF